MDKKVLECVKRIYFGIVVYNIIGIVILFIIKQSSFSTIVGLIAGSIVSMIALMLLTISISSLVNKDKTKASLLHMLGYIIRLAMYAAILVYAAITKHINLYTVAIGLVSTSMVIRFQNLILAKFKRKEA